MIRKRFLVHKSGCGICGEPLIYNGSPKKMACFYCEEEKQADVFCPNEHFICDACHRVDANDYIQKECLSSKQTNPVHFAIELMHNETFSMHGPEHHFLVAAVLLTTYNNVTHKYADLKKVLQVVRQRMVKIPGEVCTTHGGCGAVLGAGAFAAYVTKNTALSEKTWGDIHRLTASAFFQVAYYGGPRCCKRNTFIALLAGQHWLNENMGVVLEKSESIQCDFFGSNKDCIGKKCLFFPSK
jgi:hypothetical protein